MLKYASLRSTTRIKPLYSREEILSPCATDCTTPCKGPVVVLCTKDVTPKEDRLLTCSSHLRLVEHMVVHGWESTL